MAEIRINATGELKLYDSDDSNYVSFKSGGTVSSDVTWTLPTADGSSGQMLSTDGSGTLSWATASSADPSSADGDTLGTASAEWSDLYLADGGIVYFGNDQDIRLTHNADKGLIIKHSATADDKPVILTLQTGETDMAANDVIGKIEFQAPDEGTGTDAILVSAAIQAVAEGDHSSSSNATRLEFMTGASEAAASKMTLSSGGVLDVDGGITIDNITIDGTEIDLSSGDLTLDVAGDIYLNADGGDIVFQDGSATTGKISYSGGNIDISSDGSDNDIVFKGNDGGSAVTALTIDMSAAGDLLQGTASKITSNGAIASFTNHNGSATETAIATSDGNEKVRCFNDAKITFETGGSEQMRLDSAGHLLINATAQTVGASCAIKNDTTETTLEIVNVSTSGTHRCVDFRNGDGDIGGSININTGSDSVSFETSSDYRLKENVVDLTGAITRIKNLKPKRFNFKKDTDTTLDGFIAHEAQAVVPQAVSGVKDGTETRENIVINNKGNVIACDITEAEWTKRKSDGEFANDTEWFASKEFIVKQGIDQAKLVPLLTAALQEAITKIETLETEMTALKARVKTLEDA